MGADQAHVILCKSSVELDTVETNGIPQFLRTYNFSSINSFDETSNDVLSFRNDYSTMTQVLKSSFVYVPNCSIIICMEHTI